MPIPPGVTLTAFLPLNTDSFDLSDLLTGTVTVLDTNTLLAESLDGSRAVTFGGVGFTYDPGTGLIDGTVGSIAVAVSGTAAVTITGLDVPLPDIAALAAPGGAEAMAAQLLAGNDTITGSGGGDLLSGSAGRDRLNGGDGNDTIYGGADRDRLTGGDGADVFVFGDVTESSARARSRDVITDFDRDEGDLIDLSGLGLLTFHDGDNFTGEAGEIIATATRKGMLVQVDVDGDSDADFSIMINGASSVRATDFVLLTLE